MKAYERQSKVQGYTFNTAALLKEITGEVSLTKLKSLTADFIETIGATEEEINNAFFFTCNEFDITVD